MYHPALIALFSTALIAGCSSGEVTQCTGEPRSNWQDAEQFQQGLTDEGYQINAFKITEGNCYEIYGTDPQQTKVEIYFNPVDGSVVKREEG